MKMQRLRTRSSFFLLIFSFDLDTIIQLFYFFNFYYYQIRITDKP
jgi:hypothetical protein